jgi:nucleolin
LTTASPFLIRSKPQSLTSINFRRFASNDVASEAQENTASIPSADAEDSSVVRSAIESASESASTYTPEAAEQATESFSNSEEAIVDAAKAAGAAAGLSAPPRSREVGGRGNDRQERRRPEQADVLPSNSIYVGNLSFEISEADLAQEFATFGEVKNTIIATDARGMSKGYVLLPKMVVWF